MSMEIWHHGILGMKWGIRRTPEQLGHESGSSGKNGTGDSDAETSAKKASRTSSKSSQRMTDDELRDAIARLNMEEQYDNLVARQKARNTGKIKQALGDAFEKFGRGLLDKAVNKALDKMFTKEDKFDIDEWRDKDVNEMDSDTIQKVSKWYANAQSITKVRELLNPSSKTDSKEDSSKSTSSSSSEKKSSDSTSSSSSKENGSKTTSSSSSSARTPFERLRNEAAQQPQKTKEEVTQERKKQDEEWYKWIG